MPFEDRVEMTVMSCVNCGVRYALPSHLLAQRRRDGEEFYCPVGHVQSYDPEEIDAIAVEKRRAALIAVHLQEQHEAKVQELAEKAAAEKAAAESGTPAAPRKRGRPRKHQEDTNA